MLQSYLKTAFRNLWRRKSYTLLHVMGLAIGMATCLLVYLYIQHEMSFDQYHQLGDRCYRVNLVYTFENRSSYNGESPYPLAEALRLDFPQFEKVARIQLDGSGQVTVDQEQYMESNILFVEPVGFKVESWKMVSAG